MLYTDASTIKKYLILFAGAAGIFQDLLFFECLKRLAFVRGASVVHQ